MNILTYIKGLLMRVAVLVSSLRGRLNGKDTSLAEKGREESKGRTQRKRSSKLQEGNSKSSSKVRRQPKKGKFSGKDGGNARTGKGLKGTTNSTPSQLKSMGSIEQSRRKEEGRGNKQTKQSKKT